MPPQMFAAGGKKGKSMDKEGAARFKKDIITYKNQALQPASFWVSTLILGLIAATPTCHSKKQMCISVDMLEGCILGEETVLFDSKGMRG